MSTVGKKKYHINPNVNCKHSGIYGITCKCVDQYAGKTTVTNCVRFKEHWSKETSVRKHLRSCPCKPTIDSVKVQFLENVWDRGKYSLSEREFLWNKRLKGNINVQKTISKWSVFHIYLVQSCDILFLSAFDASFFIFQLTMRQIPKAGVKTCPNK